VKASVLAVGTEVVDGQIIDRNSAWLSDRSVAAGLEMVEHRSVPDDRSLIAQGLRELSDKSDLVFVTGGLGPTSDDFTRELIAEVYARPLKYDDGSWQKIVKRFEDRGAVAKPIQKQQCHFPEGARILDNPIGTANAFSLKLDWNGKPLEVIVLPGPPAEIAAIWDLHLAQPISVLVPKDEREDLLIWQTLGLGEGDIAEKVEDAIRGSGLRVGYRAHLPYIEVKLWIPRETAAAAKPFIDRVDEALKEWTVGRDQNDTADAIVRSVYAGSDISILDRVTGGYVQTRVLEALDRIRKAHPTREPKGSLRITTSVIVHSVEPGETPSGDSIMLQLLPDLAKKQWMLKMSGANPQNLAFEPTSLYSFGSERGHTYLAEKMFHALSSLAPFVIKEG
jgi:nicotinamide-nucleotide amidase